MNLMRHLVNVYMTVPKMMGIWLPLSVLAKKAAVVPKGPFAVYVGESRKRFVIPTPYSTFQALLRRAEEEFGFEHHSGLTIPCHEDAFQALTAQMACA
ncbi:unnamed protein product [Victoria cruziana]